MKVAILLASVASFLVVSNAWAVDPAKFEIHAASPAVGENTREYPEIPEADRPAAKLLLDKTVLLDGAMIRSADFSLPDADGRIGIYIRLTPEGKQRFAEVTTRYCHDRIAVVLDGQVIMAATINEPLLGGSLEIRDDFTGSQLGKILDRIRTCIPAAAP